MEKLRLFEDQIKGILKGPSSPFMMLQFVTTCYLGRASPPLINEVLLCISCRNFSQFFSPKVIYFFLEEEADCRWIFRRTEENEKRHQVIN